MPHPQPEPISVNSLPRASHWKWVFRALLAAYWVALFLATHLQVPKIIQKEVWTYDKGIHGAAYFVLAGLLVLSNGWPFRLSSRRLMVLVCVVVGYAALDEWLQTFVGRVGDVRDWVSDSIGGICALLIAWALQGAFIRRDKSESLG
jgi:VanZ family protein